MWTKLVHEMVLLVDLFPPGEWDTGGELCPLSVSSCSVVSASILKEYNFVSLWEFTHSF